MLFEHLQKLLHELRLRRHLGARNARELTTQLSMIHIVRVVDHAPRRDLTRRLDLGGERRLLGLNVAVLSLIHI